MNQLAEWVASATGLGPETSVNVVNTAAVLLFLWAVRTLALRTVWRRTDDAKTRYSWRKVSGHATAVIGVLVVGRI